MNAPWDAGNGLGFDGTGPLYPYGKWNDQHKREVWARGHHSQGLLITIASAHPNTRLRDLVRRIPHAVSAGSRLCRRSYAGAAMPAQLIA